MLIELPQSKQGGRRSDAWFYAPSVGRSWSRQRPLTYVNAEWAVAANRALQAPTSDRMRDAKAVDRCLPKHRSKPQEGGYISETNVAGRILLALAIALTSLSAMSPKRTDQSTDDREIRIGNLIPYTGPLAEFAAIGKAEAAYFDMINERGGINGRKVRFISYDDKSDPTMALELTRWSRRITFY